MGIGSTGSLGGLWNKLKSGVTTAIHSLSFLPSGTPVLGGVVSASKLAVNSIRIPNPLFDNSVDDIDEFDNTTTSSVSIARIMNRKVFGIPIVPLMLGGVVLTFFFKGGK